MTTTYNNKHVIIYLILLAAFSTKEIAWIKQFFFTCYYFIIKWGLSCVFNISSLYANTNSLRRCFWHEQFLISKC